MDIDQVKFTLERFEEKIKAALDEKYRGYPEEVRETVLSTSVLQRVDLLAFFNIYIGVKRYPIERLHEVAEYCMDFKLQLYYILEADMGLYNKIIYPLGYSKAEPNKTPHLMLVRQSLDQTMIMKSRVLWERAMNLIYYLETGESIENKVSGNKSKRKVFSEFLSGSTQWQFMNQYMLALSDYEQKFRAPESHKKSVFRAELMGNKSIDPNDLLDLLNYGMNTIWPAIMSALEGKPINFRFVISGVGSIKIKN